MYELPNLPYDKKDLAPIITEEGFDYHHGKHHQAYITKLNQAIEDTAWADKSLNDIVIDSYKMGETALFNNAAQHDNHSFTGNVFRPMEVDSLLERLRN